MTRRTGHVAHTEGEQLMVRSGPGTNYGVVAALGSSDYVQISCQKAGETIHGNVYWDWLPDYGGYASDHYLYTSEGNGRLASLPLCGSSPPSTSIRTKIKQIAEAELGLTDGNKYHQGIGLPSDAWCQYFVNWVWARAGVPNMFNANGFTGNFYWWGVNRGLADDWPATIEVGDAVLFGSGPVNPDTSLHVGIVVPVALLAAIVITPGVSQASLSNPARGTTIRAIDAVNLRSGPSTSDDVMATAVAGDTATVLNTAPTNGFYRVGFQGKVGWTHGDYWATTPGLVINGHRLLANEEAAVRWIAANTMPRVAGALSERLTLVSRVSWWSLKEGVLALGNPHSYSNCGDSDRNPLSYCTAAARQVGISAVQQGTFSLSQSEAVATQLYPGWTVGDVLAHTATYAGYAAGSAGYNQIVNSSGTFRNSWLLRNHGVGFTLNAPIVTSECVDNSLYWCYGTGWDTSTWYAPNRAAALRAIGELRSILYALAPA